MPELYQFRELCIWMMTSDPFPLGSDMFTIEIWLDSVAQVYGFDNWIEAYHSL